LNKHINKEFHRIIITGIAGSTLTSSRRQENSVIVLGVWWSKCYISVKVPGLIPDEIIGFFD
jgi:hypothetical protein